MLLDKFFFYDYFILDIKRKKVEKERVLVYLFCCFKISLFKIIVEVVVFFIRGYMNFILFLGIIVFY